MKRGGIAHLTPAQVSEMVDQELALAGRDDARWHLEQCDRCRTELGEARALLARSREARIGVPAPPELWTLVAASTIHAGAVRRRVMRSARGMLVAGAIVLVLATALLTAWAFGAFRPRPETPGGPAPSAGPAGGAAPAPEAPRPPVPPGEAAR